MTPKSPVPIIGQPLLRRRHDALSVRAAETAHNRA